MSTIIHTDAPEHTALGSSMVVKEDLPFAQRHFDLHVERNHPSIQFTLVSGKPIVLPVSRIVAFEVFRDSKKDAA